MAGTNVVGPGWIQLLYQRQNAEHALHTAFLLNLTNEDIAKEADSQVDGREQLRRVAIDELGSIDPRIAAWSLICLGVVGRREDLPSVERLLNNPSDVIQRAARVCLFELGQNKSIRDA